MSYRQLSTPEIEQLILELDNVIKDRKRLERKSSKKVPSPRELALVEEYERRSKAGETLDPLVAKVDLEELVGSEIFEKTLRMDDSLAANNTTLRGIPLTFSSPNLRALWQSFGQEYIEPELLDFIDGMSAGSIFFDIGASTGVFSIYAAAKGVKTYCFEPEVANFNILNNNAYLNFGKVHQHFNAFNIALSTKTETSTMFIRKFEASAHEKILGKADARDGTHSFDSEYKQRVLCMSLDEICALEGVVPTDIKIDVDGAELAVIAGMAETLKSPQLKRIFIEISDAEEASQATLKMLLDSGFSIASKKRVQNYFNEFNYTLVRG